MLEFEISINICVSSGIVQPLFGYFMMHLMRAFCHTMLCSVFARIESGQGADLGKGHFCVRSIILRALLRVILHFEGTMGK